MQKQIKTNKNVPDINYVYDILNFMKYPIIVYIIVKTRELFIRYIKTYQKKINILK